MEGPICDVCLLKLIEKRVRREIRIKKLFTRTDSILILDDSSLEFALSKHLLSNIIKSKDVNFSTLKIKNRFELDIKELKRFVRKNKITKMVLPWNLENEVELQLTKMFSNLKKDKQKLPIIKLLRNVSQREIVEFAKIKKFKGKQIKPYNPEINNLLGELEKNHPEIKFSTIKSFDKLNI